MSKISLIEIESNGQKSEHVFLENEGSKSLVVFFPGGNNSCERPIFHYLTRFFIDENKDVICISYKNITKREDSYEEKINSLTSGINEAILKTNKIYSDIIFISRSFGNIVSCELKKRYSINVFKSIYISPTSPALKFFDEYPGFIITSTNDEYLTKDEINELSKLGDERLLILNEGNHSLETKNIYDTMNFGNIAVSKIIDYIRK